MKTPRSLTPIALMFCAAAASAQGIVLAGRMGERALLMVDGQPHTLAVGQAAAGVRLLRWQEDSVVIERAGSSYTLRIGGSPSQLGGVRASPGAREIVITAGPGGHFVTGGTINGRATRFMVDTGATLLAMGRDDAERLGVDLRDARSGVSHTANGAVAVQMVTLPRVRVGEVELYNIGAVVMPVSMPFVLLGNSFLTRFQMRRENDVMRLELR